MADAPPPAKRARHHYDLAKTFDVLVGKEPNPQRFTAHHDLLVQRSEFFKAARSSRWMQPDQPITLVDHDPEIFSTYLHCLYFGVDAIKDRLSVIVAQSGSTNEPTVSADESSHSGKAASGNEDSSSESNSDSDSASDEGQRKQQIIEMTTQNPPNKLTILVNGEEEEATTTLYVGNLSWATEQKTLSLIKPVVVPLAVCRRENSPFKIGVRLHQRSKC